MRTTTDVTELGDLMCIWAHPDDESYLAGGLMGALRRAGHRVVCVTATRGDAGETGTVPLGAETLASVRERELARALAALGVEEHHWLGYRDGTCEKQDPDEAGAAIAAVVDRVRPDVVVSFGPDGFTGHPDHRAVGDWTERALASLGPAAPRLLRPVVTAGDLERHRPVNDLLGVFTLGGPRVCAPGDLAVRLDLSGELLRRKIAALTAHRSQTAGILEVLGGRSYADWVSTESFA